MKVKRLIKKLLPWFFIFIASIGYAKEVTLSWDPSPTDGVDKYIIYYDAAENSILNNGMIAPKDLNEIYRINAGNVLTYKFYELEDNKTHTFGVTAGIGTDESVLSNVVESPATIIDPPILNLDIQWELLK